jgi:Magnesium chelatase, subunit ChlI
MLARRLPTILPAMTHAEAIDTTRIHRIAGLTGARTAWVTTRPCRAPVIPSRMSLAYHGRRILEERSACRRTALERLSQLREPGVTRTSFPVHHRLPGPGHTYTTVPEHGMGASNRTPHAAYSSSRGASSTSRTFHARVSAVKGFCKKAVPSSVTP